MYQVVVKKNCSPEHNGTISFAVGELVPFYDNCEDCLGKVCEPSWVGRKYLIRTQHVPTQSAMCWRTKLYLPSTTLDTELILWHTVTDLANSCATPLFRRPQGSQGCLEKQNHSLSWNLVVWCAKIGPKTKKVWKTSELTKKMSKLMVFWWFFKVSWFCVQF